MAGHPNLEAILISVQIFHLTISHSDMGDLKKMQPKRDIGGQLSKLLYHYIFYIILTREHQNFRNKYWLKNKI